MRTLVNLIALSGPFTGISVLHILATGFYMALTRGTSRLAGLQSADQPSTNDHITETNRVIGVTDANAAR